MDKFDRFMQRYGVVAGGAIAGAAAGFVVGNLVPTQIPFQSYMNLGGVLGGLSGYVVSSPRFYELIDDAKVYYKNKRFEMLHPDFDKKLLRPGLRDYVHNTEKEFRQRGQIDELNRPLLFKGKDWQDFTLYKQLADDYLHTKSLGTRLVLSKSSNNVVYDEKTKSLVFSSDGKAYKIENATFLHTGHERHGKDSLVFGVDIHNFCFVGQRNTNFAAFSAFVQSSGLRSMSKECVMSSVSYSAQKKHEHDALEAQKKREYTAREQEYKQHFDKSRESVEVVHDFKRSNYQRTRGGRSL